MSKTREKVRLLLVLVVLACVAVNVSLLLTQKLDVERIIMAQRYVLIQAVEKYHTQESALDNRAFSKAENNSTGTPINTTNIQNTTTPTTYQKECQTQRVMETNKARPRVRLDPNKIMYPVLLWGPNNQLEGLRESIYIAIKLNRTLVVPHFFPQHNDRSGKRIHLVSAANRIDLAKLSRFISVMSIEDMQKHCNHSFDIVFQNRQQRCEAVKEVERDTRMNILDVPRIQGLNGTINMTSEDSQQQQRCRQPSISALPELAKDKIKHDIRKLREIFNSTARCAVLLFPYDSLSVTAKAGYRPVEYSIEEDIINITQTENIQKASIPLLMAAIEHATDRPPYIKKIVDRFLREVVNATFYVAVHWRFDKEMMQHFCKRRPSFCHDDPGPLEIARAIATVQKQVADSRKQGIPVYIAAPPTVNALIAKVKHYLENPDEMTNKTDNLTKLNTDNSAASVYNAAQLTPFVERHYPPESCPDIRPTPNDLLSLLEMEIAQRSRAFLCSIGSTWSATVRRKRPPELYPFDRSIMHMIVGQGKEAEKWTRNSMYCRAKKHISSAKEVRLGVYS